MWKLSWAKCDAQVKVVDRWYDPDNELMLCQFSVFMDKTVKGKKNIYI